MVGVGYTTRSFLDLSLFSPNTGKYEPEKTPYLNTFHVVEHSGSDFCNFIVMFQKLVTTFANAIVNVTSNGKAMSLEITLCKSDRKRCRKGRTSNYFRWSFNSRSK